MTTSKKRHIRNALKALKKFIPLERNPFIQKAFNLLNYDTTVLVGGVA